MCGRVKLTPIDKTIAEQLKLKGHDAFMATVQGIDWDKQGIISPNQEAPLITMDREIQVMRWGLPLEMQSKRDNALYWARSETVFSQTVFAPHAMRRRAVMLINGWWEHNRYVAPEQPIAIATIWTELKDKRYFAMVTMESSLKLAQVHDRMPAIVDPDRWLNDKRIDDWFGEVKIAA